MPLLPVAKPNLNGKLVTNTGKVKELLLNTFLFLMRHRPMKSELYKLQILRERLLYIRLEARRGKVHDGVSVSYVMY